MEYIKISDCAVIKQGKNIDKKFLNTDKKGLPYIVGASCIKDFGVVCEKYTEYPTKSEISYLGDVIISTVGTLGKMAVNNIGDCVLSKHVCAVRFVPEILPEYGLLCIMGAIKSAIPDDNGTGIGFSKKLDIDVIGNLPLLLVGINTQMETVNKMLMIGKEFFLIKKVEPILDDLSSPDPITLINEFERRMSKSLREQRKALNEIVKLVKGERNQEENQMNIFDMIDEVTI